MRRVTQNLIVDVVAFVCFVLLASTGVIMRFSLPPGSGRHVGIFGLDRHGWGDIHFWIALALLGVLALHLVLHWKWIVCVVRGRPREGSGPRAMLGLMGLLAAIALVAAPLLAPVETIEVAPGEGRHGARGDELLDSEGEEAQDRPAENDIRGSLTLAELEAQTGVPAAHVLQKLGLPAETPRDMRLGQLRRRHGFYMGDVRRIVDEYPSEE
jgi:hypothetical protein